MSRHNNNAMHDSMLDEKTKEKLLSELRSLFPDAHWFDNSANKKAFIQGAWVTGESDNKFLGFDIDSAVSTAIKIKAGGVL